MKLTTIIGAVVAAIGIAACGPTVRPTVPPSTVTPTVAATAVPTTTATGVPSGTPTPTTTPTPTPSPTSCDAISGGQCPEWGFTTTCAVPGSAQGGSVTITFTNGTPDTIVIDGNTLNVTTNPFTFGPLTVGSHSMILEGFNAGFTVAGCPAPPSVSS
ncbi:MAG: hypothetical protein WCB51_03350 [Candidatus Dormiibacterota bacterium]